eukprot:scaffold121703_cov52-Attheya_sp.AAC.1
MAGYYGPGGGQGAYDVDVFGSEPNQGQRGGNYYGEHPEEFGSQQHSKRRHHNKKHNNTYQPPDTSSVREQTPALDLMVQGRSCRFHRDDTLAESLERGQHLIDLLEDRILSDKAIAGLRASNDDTGTPQGERTDNNKTPVLLTDRYDARALLDDHDLFPVHSVATAPIDTEANDLNFERYGSLPEYRTIFLGETPYTENLPIQPSHEKKMDTEEIVSDERKDPALELSLEEKLQIPHGMVIAPTQRQQDVILMTAKRSVSAPQFEVLLKVKQADNSDFRFLHAGHALHPYYTWLKQRGGTIVPVTEIVHTSSDSQNNDDATNGAMTGLLGVYSSSDEEDDDVDETKKSSTNDTMNGLLGVYSSSSSDEEDEDDQTDNKDVGHITTNVAESGPRIEDMTQKSTSASDNDRLDPNTIPMIDDSSAFSSSVEVNESSTCDGDEPARSSESIHTAIAEQRAKRLKRARMMKGHFALKLMENKKERSIETAIGEEASIGVAESLHDISSTHEKEDTQQLDENSDHTVGVSASSSSVPLEKSSQSHDGEPARSSESIHAAIVDQRAKRLKRARMMKGHFALKVMEQKEKL